MEEILDHLGCIIPANNGMITISTGAGFLPSTVAQVSNPRFPPSKNPHLHPPWLLAENAGSLPAAKIFEPPESVSQKPSWSTYGTVPILLGVAKSLN